MKNRIKNLRKELSLTQQEFADKIGISRGNIGAYEVGKNVPSDAVISLICREFNVREEWLRTGEGEMFKPKPSDILDQLAYKYKLFNFDYVMIEKFLAMPPDLRRAIYDHFHDVDAALAKMDPYAPAYAGNEPPQPMDRIMETIKSQQKENAAPNISIEQAEAAYIKSRLNSALKTTSFASNTIEENTKKKNA